MTDGAQRRTGEKVNGVLAKRWLYQDQLKPVAELDFSGNISSRYIYGTRAHVPDMEQADGGTYRFITDHLGSPRLIVEINYGAIVQELRFNEFGSAILNSKAGFQPFGFAGGLLDNRTALTRFGSRDYDRAAGRWLSLDPEGFASGDANLYAYTEGDPINLIDVTGGSGCHALADLLIEIARTRPSRRPAGMGMLASAQMLREKHTQLPYDGFRPSLVADGQKGQAWAHVMGHAGAIVLGTPIGRKIINDKTRSDLDQLFDIPGERPSGRRKETLAELAGNVAGQQVGKVLVDIIENNLDPSEARRRAHEILCKDKCP